MLSPKLPFERLQITIAPSSIRRRKVMVLLGCASMLRRLGTMSALPILFWIGATASPRKLSEYPAYSFCQNARTTGSLT